MASYTLNKHIFRLSAGLVLLCTTAILFSVWSSTIEHAKRQLSDTLEVAQSVVVEIMGNREEQLFNSASVLTDDFGFKQAVASGDANTIESVLLNHGARVEADLMALLSLDGMVTQATLDDIEQQTTLVSSELIAETLQVGGATSVVLINQRLYQILLLTVDAPRPIAIAMIGFELDMAFLERLKAITLLETTMSVKQGDDLLFRRTTLNDLQTVTSTSSDIESLSWLSLVTLNNNHFVSQEFSLLSDEDYQVTIGLSDNIERLFNEFNDLQITITLIAATCLALSLLFGAAVAKRLSRPLLRLSMISQKIAAGDYEQAIDIRSRTTEIADLTGSFMSMQSNIKEREAQIKFQASHDILTGLLNRYAINDVINQQFDSGAEFQVIGVNILGFRGINDVFGHHNGDSCLQVIATRLQALGGQAARLNGGEFLWLPEQIQSQRRLHEIQRELHQPIEVEGVVIQLRVAIGEVLCPTDSADTTTLLKHLTITLDQARTESSLMVRYCADFEAQYTRRITIITALKEALVTGSELSLVYQPKLHMSSLSITHVEALLRWNSVSLGFVPPDEFIAVAEQSGLIKDVTHWVINRAISDVQAMKQQGVNVCVAINLAASDILNDDLLPMIIDKSMQAGLTNENLAFEITESDLVADHQLAIQQLSRYREAGYSLAIDDFGTGYSSMAYLKNLPVTDLKIDKSFVLKLANNESDQQIVQTIIGLAHSFGLQVIAEGVEDKASLALLNHWKCEYAQGYFISRPAPLNEIIVWIQKYKDLPWSD
ncbi:EAL domain-containing protein [Alteromonas sp. ASW11-36]|uniref:EAL domain-containing protein n=1 Tax=Alteromonas arenosi TaxID=3055817 RepID=A0ABT7SWI0_9ALTE|nr:GGDEF domain-containing phosphodiesterase [Alteromonas sp. ASW11-36]MDM7860548.1 EAL domain-containing protein [Alteromonas sp. ASW11-36]